MDYLNQTKVRLNNVGQATAQRQQMIVSYNHKIIFLFRRTFARAASGAIGFCGIVRFVRVPVAVFGLVAILGSVATLGINGEARAQNENELCRAGAVPDYDNVQSLEKIFGAVERGVGGQIIRAELRQRGFQNLCVWVYEVKTLDNSGKVTMAIYDASDMKLIGFNSASSPDIGPVVQVPQVDSTRKSLAEPDGDGHADSGGAEAATGDGGFSESDASTADSTDNGQRGGSAGPKGEASADSGASGTDSATAADSDSDSDAAAASGDSGGTAAAASQ